MMQGNKPQHHRTEAATTPLDLEAYRSVIHLDEPFEPPPPDSIDEAERTEFVDALLAYLQAEPHSLKFHGSPSSYGEKRRLLRAMLTVRQPDPLPNGFHHQFDQLLQREVYEQGLTDAAKLVRVAQGWPQSTYTAASQSVLWRGDITRLIVDAIVNAANAQLLGCFQPFHACIDNAIHSAAGPRLREDCQAIMQRQDGLEGTGWAKVTRAYNLPAKYVLHTVGPIIPPGSQRVLPEQEEQLAACYRSCLELARRVPAIRSVAFCCISTGVFGFPQVPAARIALSTVADWLASHPDALDLVVFNVFRSDDEEIYQTVLRGI